MAKQNNTFLNVGNQAMVRPESLCFGKYFDDKGVYGMGFDGTTKLYVKESDRAHGLALQRQVCDGVMNCGDGNPRIILPDSAFIALSVIDKIEIWDGKIVIKNTIDGKVVQRFSPNDFESLEEVMAQLNRAMATAHKRTPYRVDWASLAADQDEQEDDEELDDAEQSSGGETSSSAATVVGPVKADSAKSNQKDSASTGGKSQNQPLKAAS